MTFFELEKECKKRRIKKWLIIIFLIFFLIIIYFLVKFLYPTKKTEIKKIPEKIVKKEKKQIKPIKVKKIIKKEILKPIIDLNISDEEIINQEEKKLNKKIEKKVENNKTKKIVLNTSSLPSFDTCILLAEKYYKNKDYEDALKWAKNANIQNKTNPKSWIIVAKSLYKLGKKEKAIKILKLYYKYTKNKEVLELIKRIESDKAF